MKMRRGRANYRAPDIGRIEMAWIDLGERKMQGVRYTLMLISVHGMFDMRYKNKNVCLGGVPRYLAHSSVKRMFMLFPCPDRGGEFGVRYYPPAMEV